MNWLPMVLGVMFLHLAVGVFALYDPPASLPPPEEFARILSQETVPREDTVVNLEKRLEAQLGLPRGRQIPFGQSEANEVIIVHVGGKKDSLNS